jgi:acetolactate synthase-1/2/3 large subunit
LITPELLAALQQAKRPVFIWGAGIRPYADQARALARALGIPVACTWGAIDLMNHDDPLMCGGFGTHGTRPANFAVQNADLVISIGSRLDTKATGQPSHFARAARLAMVDIDRAEIAKFTKLGREIDFRICGDAGEFIEALQEIHLRQHYGDWLSSIDSWKRTYASPEVSWSGINPYELMKEIGSYTTKDDILCTDTGFALGWTMQAFPFKGERFLHAFNMTPMGYGLPAAIGAGFANIQKTAGTNQIVLITGDGSLMMALSELATVSRWKLPIKIILLDNKGHGMCRQTQRQWLGGEYPATSVQGGLGFPRWGFIPAAFDIQWCDSLKRLFSIQGPGFHTILIPQEAHLIPQARYGQPIEDAEPLLPWAELCEQMIIPTLERERV